MKRLRLTLNIFAFVLGTLALQSCEDTSDGYQHYQHGYYNRNYYNRDAYNSGYYNENPYNRGYYNQSRYNGEYYPSDRPSIDVHL